MHAYHILRAVRNKCAVQGKLGKVTKSNRGNVKTEPIHMPVEKLRMFLEPDTCFCDPVKTALVNEMVSLGGGIVSTYFNRHGGRVFCISSDLNSGKKVRVFHFEGGKCSV